MSCAALPELAAYRAVRLSEVAGLSPATKHGEFAASQPELAIRLVLRVSSYDKDKVLMRILSRIRVAMLSSITAEAIAQTCERVP